MTSPTEKLKQLENLEKELAAALHAASQAVLELSKEKPSIKQTETYSTTFLKTLENLESGLSKHISYLTQVSTATVSLVTYYSNPWSVTALSFYCDEGCWILSIQNWSGQAHEGSSYASQKTMQMAVHRLKHSQSRLKELECLKNQHLQQGNPQQIHRQQSPPS